MKPTTEKFEEILRKASKVFNKVITKTKKKDKAIYKLNKLTANLDILAQDFYKIEMPTYDNKLGREEMQLREIINLSLMIFELIKNNYDFSYIKKVLNYEKEKLDVFIDELNMGIYDNDPHSA